MSNEKDNKKNKNSLFKDISIKGEPDITIIKIMKRKSKKNIALLKKAAKMARKLKEDEEKDLVSGKKFDRFAEMKKRRKKLLED